MQVDVEVSVVHYSSTGNIHAPAVQLLRVAEPAGGDPYGVGATDGGEHGPSDASRAAARYLRQRIVEKAALLTRRPALTPSGAQR